jgi:hypothetical protein
MRRESCGLPVYKITATRPGNRRCVNAEDLRIDLLIG